MLFRTVRVSKFIGLQYNCVSPYTN